MPAAAGRTKWQADFGVAATIANVVAESY